METSTVVAIGIAVVVIGGIIYFFKTSSNNDSNQKGGLDVSNACGFLDLKNAKYEIVEHLKFEDLIKWFQSMEMKKGVDIPFTLSKLPQDIQKEGYTVIMLGVLDNDEIKNYDLIYYKVADDKIKDMLSHAENGIVVLG